MKKLKSRKHLRHLCRSRGTVLADAQSVIDGGTIAESVSSIRSRIIQRGGTCTVKTARARFDVAAVTVEIYREQQKLGDRRRRQAELPGPLTVAARKTRQLHRIAGCTWIGGRYSGVTTRVVTAVAREDVSAWTTISQGDQYGGKSRYYTRDATHHLHLCLSDLVEARKTPVPPSIDGNPVVSAQQTRPGIYEVRVVAVEVGKQISIARGYVADQGGGGMWHLAKTERGAVVALNRAMRATEAARVGDINASLVRSWGWCSAGVRQWCERHGIRRDVRRRLRAGTSSRAIARLITRHGGPRDAYERRLVSAAG